MRIKTYLRKMFLLSIPLLSLPGATMALDTGGPPDAEVMQGLYPGKAILPTPSGPFPAGSTGGRHTCTPGCHSMPGCLAASLDTRMPTA